MWVAGKTKNLQLETKEAIFQDMILATALAIFLSASTPQPGTAPLTQSQSQIGELFTQISDLEDQNRKLQGKVEEAQFNLDKLQKENAALKKQESDATNAAAAAAASAASAASTCAAATKPKTATEDPEPSADSAPKITNKPAVDSTPNDDFSKSFDYMTDGNVDEAKKGFTAFVKKYSHSALSGEAYYWLGEIAFDKQDYNSAAISYLKGYREYPKGAKAPENILKLALTLKELGNNDEACKNLTRFNSEFKNAHVSLLARAKNQRQELKCK